MELVAQPAEYVDDLVYMYATMILHEGNQNVTPESIAGVLTSVDIQPDMDYTRHIATRYHEMFPNGEGWKEVINAPPEPEYTPHPISIVNDLLKPEEPEVEEESEEENDLWTNLFGDT